GAPRQLIGAPPAWSLPFVDLTTESDARAAAESWMAADLARAIDPTDGLLFGFALFKAAADRFFWYARYHHIVIDGFAMGLLARRVAEIYTKLSTGRGGHEGSFGRFALLLERDNAYRASEQFVEDRRFWLEHLVDAPEPISLSARHSAQSG